MERNERVVTLGEAVQRWRRGMDGGVELRPASAYEAVTRQMVESLRDDLHEIKGRLNGLLFMVAGTVLLDVALRVSGIRADVAGATAAHEMTRLAEMVRAAAPPGNEFRAH